MVIIPEHLRQDIRAYEAMIGELQQHHAGKFVIIRDGLLQGAFDTFDAAAREAIKRFGDGPYLIRQVGAPRTMPMPASVAFSPRRAERGSGSAGGWLILADRPAAIRPTVLEDEIRTSKADIRGMVAESHAEFQQLRADFQEFRAALAEDIHQYRQDVQKQAVEVANAKAEFQQESVKYFRWTMGIVFSTITIGLALISLQIHMGKDASGQGGLGSAQAQQAQPPIIINVPPSAPSIAPEPEHPAKP